MDTTIPNQPTHKCVKASPVEQLIHDNFKELKKKLNASKTVKNVIKRKKAELKGNGGGESGKGIAN